MACHHAKYDSSNSQNRDLKCSKCQDKGHIASHHPNMRVMILHGDGEYKPEEETEQEEMPLLEDASDVEEAEMVRTVICENTLCELHIVPFIVLDYICRPL